MEPLIQPTLLIVDDTETNIDLLVSALGNDYDINVAMDGKTALQSVAEKLPDLILLDIMMPGMDGYQVCEILKQDRKTKRIPVIFLTALSDEQDESRGLALGGIDYITKPFNPFLLKARIRNHLLLKHYQDHLEELVRERTIQLERTQEATMKSMGTLAEYRDPETGGHIKRTQNHVRLLAENLRDHPRFRSYLTPEKIQDLYKSAPLHDIGKVGVPDNILLKPGKLTPEEFEKMQQHTVYGRDAIAASEKELGDETTFLSVAKEIAFTHHEKWDGSGYPQGLAGDAIPIPGRIMAIADVYDALISKRVYKPPFPHEKAVNIIHEGRGIHFDPDMVDVFLTVSEKCREIALEFADFDEERDCLSQ